MLQSQSRSCSQSVTNAHNCSSVAEDPSSVGGDGSVTGSGEIMLFGVRVKVDPMRKSVSMNNLSQYEPCDSDNLDVSAAVAADTGYASADDAGRNQSIVNRGRKRGVPWTEEEHRLFVLGLQKVGKGDWRGISRIFVKSRTPTQVASHAQKYFLRRSNLNRRRRRSSLFDITTDTINQVAAIPMEDQQVHEDNGTRPVSQPFTTPTFPITVAPPLQMDNQIEQIKTFHNGDHFNIESTLVRPIPQLIKPNQSLNFNQKYKTDTLPLSLNLSLSYDHTHSSSKKHSSAFQVISSFNNGDGIISVA